jgi:hypothetical protein
MTFEKGGSMPSPFPGMDPYLECELWSTVHGQLIAEIARQLAPRLRPKYLALMEKRFVSVDPNAEEGISIGTFGWSQESMVPDIAVARSEVVGAPAEGSSMAIGPLQVATVMPESVPQHWVEIRDARSRQLVTVIEVLSPANKTGDGYKEYVERRRKILLSSVHLMEIDLLRKGKRPPMRESLPDFPYFLFLSRAHRRPITDIWPVRLSDPLPRLPVPLLPPDPDVTLDLETAFTTIYDQLGYDLAVNYSSPPDVPLAGADWEWAQRLCQQ